MCGPDGVRQSILVQRRQQLVPLTEAGINNADHCFVGFHLNQMCSLGWLRALCPLHLWIIPSNMLLVLRFWSHVYDLKVPYYATSHNSSAF